MIIDEIEKTIKFLKKYNIINVLMKFKNFIFVFIFIFLIISSMYMINNDYFFNKFKYLFESKLEKEKILLLNEKNKLIEQLKLENIKINEKYLKNNNSLKNYKKLFKNKNNECIELLNKNDQLNIKLAISEINYLNLNNKYNKCNENLTINENKILFYEDIYINCDNASNTENLLMR